MAAKPNTDTANVQDLPYPVRKMDPASLKALAHPLRVQILEMLSRYGAQTACSLGELLGESSGSTSYHLRQLAKHDFVREVEGKGTARERWWERPRGAIEVSSPELASSPATQEASRLVNREFEHRRQAVLADFMAHGADSLDREWLEAAIVSTANVRMNEKQLAAYTRAMDAYSYRLLEEIRGEDEQEGARPVQIHFNAFPVLGVPASAGSRGQRRAQPAEHNPAEHNPAEHNPAEHNTAQAETSSTKESMSPERKEP